MVARPQEIQVSSIPWAPHLKGRIAIRSSQLRLR